MSNVHNVYNATIERRSGRLPSVPGIGRGWPKPSSGSISDFGFDHPSWDRAVMDQRHHWSDQPEIALKTCFFGVKHNITQAFCARSKYLK